MKAQGTPGGFALGHASGDGNSWVHWCLWSHGGKTVDKNDKVIINSPETAKALEYAKALYGNMIPGTAAWNDSSNNKAFLAGEISWTNNGISIYVAAQNSAKQIAEDMDHAYFPVGVSGKPTELHLMYPVLAMTYTKYPQACKALMAFMLEADNFNPWIQSAKGYLTHCLNAYDKNPVWTADPKATPFRDVGQAHAHRGRPRLGRREGGDRDRRLRRRRHVRQLLHRPRGREGLDRDRRAAVEADLSLARRIPAGGLQPPAGFVSLKRSRTSGIGNDDRARTAAKPSADPRTHGVGPAEGQPQLAGDLVHAAGGGVPDSVPGLSARPRRLAVVHRRAHRPRRHLRRARKLRMALGRLDVLALGVQHAALHERRQHHQIRGRALSRAAAQRAAAVQGDHPRRRADPVHRADGAVGDRVLVAVRSAVLDHFLVAARRWA